MQMKNATCSIPAYSRPARNTSVKFELTLVQLRKGLGATVENRGSAMHRSGPKTRSQMLTLRCPPGGRALNFTILDGPLEIYLPPHSLHAAWICGSAAVAPSRDAAVRRPFGPVASTSTYGRGGAILDGLGRKPAFHDQHAGTRLARPERRAEVLRVPGWCVN